MNLDSSRRFDSAVKTLALTAADLELYDSQEGTDLVLRAVEDIFTDLQSDLQPYTKDLGFSIFRHDDVTSIRVSGPQKLVAYLEYKRKREFTRGKNRLKILVGYAFGGFDPSSISEPGRKNSDEFFREDFIPIFGEESQVLWVLRTDQKTPKSNKLIVDLVIENYLKGIESYVDSSVLETLN
jgi:hypothetical protein